MFRACGRHRADRPTRPRRTFGGNLRACRARLPRARSTRRRAAERPAPLVALPPAGLGRGSGRATPRHADALQSLRRHPTRSWWPRQVPGSRGPRPQPADAAARQSQADPAATYAPRADPAVRRPAGLADRGAPAAPRHSAALSPARTRRPRGPAGPGSRARPPQTRGRGGPAIPRGGGGAAGPRRRGGRRARGRQIPAGPRGRAGKRGPDRRGQAGPRPRRPGGSGQTLARQVWPGATSGPAAVRSGTAARQVSRRRARRVPGRRGPAALVAQRAGSTGPEVRTRKSAAAQPPTHTWLRRGGPRRHRGRAEPRSTMAAGAASADVRRWLRTAATGLTDQRPTAPPPRRVSCCNRAPRRSCRPARA